MHTLSKGEVEITRLGLEDPENLHIFTDYWFDKGDGTGFSFDRNFEEEFRWQHKLVFAKQPLIICMAGIGTGKTLGVGMAAFVWGISTDGFRFMNGAAWAYQAKLMFDLIKEQITDTPAEKLVTYKESPFPIIEFAFKIGNSTYRSSMEFMSMDRNAKKIFSWRGDWINLDEAALISELDMVLMNISTRLTGNTPRGREYLGRMSLMSNPWDNDASGQLYYFFDMAADNPEECLAITLPTSANKNVSERQISNAMKFIPADEQERLLAGHRPEGKGLYFPKPAIMKCCDNLMSTIIKEKVAENQEGYKLVYVPTVGAVQYEIQSQSTYRILVGDPGTGSCPARNAPCIMVIDTEQLPEGPAQIIEFWWGNGQGRIAPFVDKLMELKEKHHPYFTGIDSTGGQAGLVEMLNITKYYDGEAKGFTGNIVGMDFSGAKKSHYLVALRILIENELFMWADVAKGIRSQLANYDPAKDRIGEPKIAQDIVATLAMGAFVIRQYYTISPKTYAQDQKPPVFDRGSANRNFRIPAAERTYRSR